MVLELENISENEELLQYKILIEDKKEIFKNTLEDKQSIDISEEYYNKPLKLVIENYMFTESNIKSWLYFIIWIIGCFFGAVNSCGKPITYTYDFILLGDGKITFNKESERAIKALKCINPIGQCKIIYKKQYNKWIFTIIVPMQIIITFVMVIVASILFKDYLIIPIILFILIQTGVYFYIKSFKKKYQFK